jgi:hypothetical protein
MRPLDFPRPATKTPPRDRRPLGNKLQEIGTRSPKDIDAFEVLADLVLERLNARDAEREA